MSKREEILEAALDIITESGVRSLTLPALFERAKTGSGTFYHHFQGSDDLVECLFVSCSEVTESVLSSNDDPTLTARQRFAYCCRSLFDLQVNHPKEMNYLFWYSRGYVIPNPDADRPVPSVRLLTDIFEQGQREGSINRDIPASLIADMVRGMLVSVYRGYEQGIYRMDTEEAMLCFANGAWRCAEAPLGF